MEKTYQPGKTYLVSFRYSEKTSCTNLVITDDTAKIDEKYDKYEWHTFRECKNWEFDTYKKRGMPINIL